MLHEKLESKRKNLTSPANSEFSAKIDKAIQSALKRCGEQLNVDISTVLDNMDIENILGQETYDAMSFYMRSKRININITYNDAISFIHNPDEFKEKLADDPELKKSCKRQKYALEDFAQCVNYYSKKIIEIAANKHNESPTVLYKVLSVIKEPSAAPIVLGLGAVCIGGASLFLSGAALLGSAFFATLATAALIGVISYNANAQEEKITKAFISDIKEITNRFINNASYSERAPTYERF
ncbi:hypothetical protein I862_05760 [endosymbiont of Acanthamoeba sp. UWC8]|uniref:hypothetical protein n=1 Tax=endosymbiont of Acanthamoeba sp. UWC8 TaxID=86106 RepID=UPI0004D0CDF8|nr:hypothetical protein [endosymbiont of Acanthamoeba sp. UWC8]AIF81706.1 hypothetical protein I862_05760 [endosymbiont of Acanthamoeba sp. UWC8]